MTLMRPFLMLASVAFVTGFAGYLAVASVTTTTSLTPYVEAGGPPANWIPASDIDGDNPGKRI